MYDKCNILYYIVQYNEFYYTSQYCTILYYAVLFSLASVIEVCFDTIRLLASKVEDQIINKTKLNNNL